MDFDFSKFISLSHQHLTFDEVLEAVFSYTQAERQRSYKIIIGSDSEGYGEVNYATAVVVHRVGAGGRAFICKNQVFTAKSLRQKIYNETALSLTLAHNVVPRLTEFLGDEFVRDNLIIHIDVGQNGETKDMIREVVGMVKGSGFQVATKPDSFAASSVADRFTAPPHKPLSQRFQLGGAL
ncbi:MAG: ribonuclease H-like YkuK family protein [Candidatus Spechtbacterales bacterium]